MTDILDSIITPFVTFAWPHIKIILILIGSTYGIKKTINILFKVDIHCRLLSAIPLLLGMIYYELWVVQVFSPWIQVVKTLIGGLIYGALATSLYDIVLDKAEKQVDKVVDAIIAKVTGKKEDVPPAPSVPPVEPPKP